MEFPSNTHLLLICLSILFIAICSLWAKFFPKQLFYSRKTLHIGCLGLLAVSIISLHNSEIFNFIYLLVMIELLLLIAVFKGFFYSEGRRSWGIVYFLPAVIFLLLAFPNDLLLIFQSVLILALADGFSALFGRMFEQYLEKSKIERLHKIKNLNIIDWGSDKKTVFGSFVGFIMIYVICYLHFPFNCDTYFFVSCFIIALVVTITEILGSNGNDNFFMPLVSFVLMKIFIQMDLLRVYFERNDLNIWFGLILFFIAAFLFIRMKWLSISGAVFAGLIALFLLLAHWSLFPIITFFILGTLAGKLNKNIESDKKHSKPRDAFQVLANGGVTLILSVLYLIYKVWYLEVLMLVSISVACADTLSSEIGMKCGKKTFGILNLKTLPKGVSGGVSWFGFWGALLGAMIIGFFRMDYFLIILMSGFLGSILDSALGLLFQAKYKVNGQITDIESAEFIGGYRFVTNDMVNFFSNIIVVGICWFFIL
jgi:uncharacterized protein (TIGR00297 family)